MRRIACLILAVCVPSLIAADLSEKWAKRIETAESTYQQAVAKADNTRFYAVQKANSDRVKALKQVLTDATKTGDFDAATEIKERITDAEQTGPRAKPKDVVRFGGHEYAVIPERVTWHVAKRMCEEMGGHLATISNADEGDFLLSLCVTSKAEPWIGATDEITEGRWRWVDGTRFDAKIHADNANEIQHYATYHPMLKTWDDGDGGGRRSYICEWDH